MMKKIINAKYVSTIEVIDPDSNDVVHLDVFKDTHSNGMFAIDESFLEQHFGDVETIYVPSPFNDNVSLKLMNNDGIKQF